VKTSQNGIDFIKRMEGVMNKPYRDVIGILTWGVGHAQQPGEVPPVEMTDDEVDALLAKDLLRFELAVSGLNADLTQNEFDACVSLAFNIGVGNFTKSTLAKLLIAGNHDAAADQFLKWNRAGGNVVQGLTNRREKERELFLS